MRFGRGTKDTESAKIEIEQIRTRVDAAQCAVQLEIVALIFLYKTSGYHWNTSPRRQCCMHLRMLALCSSSVRVLVVSPTGLNPKSLHIVLVQQFLHIGNVILLPSVSISIIFI